MKRTLLTTLLTLFAAAAFAQKGVTATVVDADTGESVVGAVVTLTPVKTPEKKQYFTSAFKGAVSIPSLAYGEYSLSVAFLGYNNLDTTFRVSASKPRTANSSRACRSKRSSREAKATLNAPAL